MAAKKLPPAKFASATRVRARKDPRLKVAVPGETTAKIDPRIAPVDRRGKDRLSTRLVLQVWESYDGLRRVILEAGEGRRWRAVRVVRASVEERWGGAGQVVATTLHQNLSQAMGRVKCWLIYGR